ncbi:GNAT family N-acetyltransferase [Terrabacter terrigena]|uniref:GNAT family N-acetyltransferase n=1 Tax=Terrabacter terrigena TaxID=574718 RepID=A0ABW3MQI8_9MICO
MTSTVADLLPALGLRVAAGPLELRGIDDDDLAVLADLAARGIHPADRMPFYHPWTDAEPDVLRTRFVQYHWRCRADFTPERWELNLGVWHEGTLVGTQGISTRDYLVTRTGETGSWLGLEHQGRGIGTAMRQAICAFAFDHLGAEEVTSGAFTDNPASLAVSRKVGYRPDGRTRLQRREGELAVNQRLVLRPEDLVRGGHAITVEGGAAFRRLVGLDATEQEQA